jgi:O-antigen ligase
MFELGLSLLVGLMMGALLVFSWGLSSKWQELIVVIPIAFAFVMLINNLEKIVLAAIAISVPLNLDVSLIISPYARNPYNMARGHRTLIALTELRLSLVLALLVIGYALWLIKPRSPDCKPVRFFAGTTIPALGLIFFSMLSVFHAQDWQLSLFRVVQLFELFLAYFYLANHLRTTEDVQFFLMVSMWAMFAESILMIVQWITGLEFIIGGVQAATLGPGRVGGTLTNPGPAAGYLSAQALITCAAIWAFPRTPQKVFAAVSFGLGSIALVGTGSRIGWGAFAVTILLFILLGLKSSWVKRETLVLLAVAVLALGATFYDTIHTRYTADDHGSTENRKKMYRLVWNIFRAHPWLGVGAGNHALVTRDYYTPDVGDPKGVIDIQVHNRYLLIWAESGTFALLCYVGFLGAAVVKAWSCAKSNHRWISLMGTGLGLAIVSLCIQMLTATFITRSITLFVWMLPALVVSLGNLEQTHS